LKIETGTKLIVATSVPATKAAFHALANFFARSDLFPLSASILPRLADVISDTDKGKRSLCAKPAYIIDDVHNFSNGYKVHKNNLTAIAMATMTGRYFCFRAI
jgi:hypothetical protein